MKQPLISCKGLRIGYENMTVLEDVSFDVKKGDYLCVVGENGAGKSTLIKCLAGLKKPMSGSITLAKGITRRDVGYLPQQTAIQRDFPASVREVVTSGCLNSDRWLPFYTKEDKDKATRYMEELGIADMAEHSFVTGEIYSIIKELNSKYRITVIMVSHDVKTAVKSANKILHVKNTVQFFGRTEDYLKSAVGKAFVGGGESHA